MKQTIFFYRPYRLKTYNLFFLPDHLVLKFKILYKKNAKNVLKKKNEKIFIFVRNFFHPTHTQNKIKKTEELSKVTRQQYKTINKIKK